MTFDKWFKEQTTLVRIILLIIPFVGWVVEVLVRLSAFLRKNSNVNLLGLLLYAILGLPLILEIIDIIFILGDEKGNLFLME